MLHTLTPLAPVAAAALPTSTLSKKNAAPHHLPSLGFHKIQASSQSDQPQLCRPVLHRRTSALGLCGLVLGLSVGGDKKADARRPPPPPPEEKQDPGLNGVTAKVLASKKRKAQMKESIAKLREKGKAIIEPASSE